MLSFCGGWWWWVAKSFSCPTQLLCCGCVVFGVVTTLFNFYYFGVRQFLVKKVEIFWVGNPLFGPLKNLKNSKFSKVTPHDLLYPKAFFVTSISTVKIRMFAKNQSSEYWILAKWRTFSRWQKISEIFDNFSKIWFLGHLQIFLNDFFGILASWTWISIHTPNKVKQQFRVKLNWD